MEFDLDAIFSKNYKIFFYCGLWKPDASRKLSYNLCTTLSFAVLIAFLLPQAIFMATNGGDLVRVTSTMYVFFTFLINLVKTCSVYLNLNTLEEILGNLTRNPLTQVKCASHRIVAERTQKIGDFLFMYGSFLGLGTQVFWTFRFLVSEDQKELPINGWYPFDVARSPCFELTVLFQFFASAFNVLLTFNVDSFTVNLMLELGMQCDFLSTTLRTLRNFRTVEGSLIHNASTLGKDERNFEKDMTENLKICIEHYAQIKRLVKMVENIYSFSLATLFLGGGLIFCAIFYQIQQINLSGTEFMYIMFFLASMLTEQFLFCWAGQRISIKSELIHRAVFAIPLWPDCGREFEKTMVTYMSWLKNPIVLYAGRLIPLSVNVFLSVIRTSYSYFTLLQTL